ncbi:MAG: PD40 domain-containing protein [Deltaproteobacteria bacterium]|nr:PD40 domain-containing protein [Deltaproteobacteria bacterium]
MGSLAPRWMLLGLGAIAALVGLPWTHTAYAQVQDRRVDWLEIESEHCRVAYPEPLGVLARRAAFLCDRSFERLADLLEHEPEGRVEVVLTDDSDSANGSASSLPFNFMRLFAQAPEDLTPLGDHDDWLNTLITHEQTHVVHLDTIGGLPAIVNKVLGKVWAPNLVQPRWFIEGLATHLESRLTAGGRIRSSMFEMYIRMDALEGRLMRLDQISSGVDRWPRGNAFYLYGSRFCRWIGDTYGDEALTAMSHEYGRRAIPYGLNRTAKRVTGHTFTELYERWQADLVAKSEALREAVEARGRVEGERLTRYGDIARSPRWLDDDTIVYSANDGANDSQLRALDRDGSDHRQVVRATGDAYWSPAEDGQVLYYGQADGHRDIYFFYDLFRHDRRTGETERLTDGLRARSPDVAPNGRTIAFTRGGAGSTHLMVADLRDVEATQRPLVRSERYEQAYTPRFSPDGRTVAFSQWRAGGYRDIRLVDLASGEVTDITHDRAYDTGPAWSPDGRHLYFSSDRTGVANLYRYDVADESLVQITDVVAGAYSPDVSPDGRSLVYLGYTSRGWDIYRLDLAGLSPRAAEPYVDDRPDPIDPSGTVVTHSERYVPARTLYPRSYFLDLVTDSFGNQLGITVAGEDIAQHMTWSARLGISLNGGYLHGDAAMLFRRLPAPIRVGAFRRISRRGGLRVAGQERTWVEEALGADISSSYRIPRAFHSESFSIGYSLAWLRQKEPFGGVLDPNTEPPVLPQTGRVASLRVGWNYNDARAHFYDMSPSEGRSVGITASVAHPVIGSEYRVTTLQWSWTRYIEAPWRQHHVFAIRYGGGISGGDLGRRGVFSAGGFSQISLVDQLIDSATLGGVALRGYQPGSRNGVQMHLAQLEYRFPLFRPMRGLSTLPVYLQRMHATVFLDAGDAFFGRLDPTTFRVGFGAELFTDVLLGYYLPWTFRLGFAYGPMEGGEAQVYFHLGVPF